MSPSCPGKLRAPHLDHHHRLSVGILMPTSLSFPHNQDTENTVIISASAHCPKERNRLPLVAPVDSVTSSLNQPHHVVF